MLEGPYNFLYFPATQVCPDPVEIKVVKTVKMTNAIWAIMFEVVRLQWCVARLTLFLAGVEGGCLFFFAATGWGKKLQLLFG